MKFWWSKVLQKQQFLENLVNFTDEPLLVHQNKFLENYQTLVHMLLLLLTENFWLALINL